MIGGASTTGPAVPRPSSAPWTAADQPVRHAALIAGVGLLLMSALAGLAGLAGLAEFVAPDGLITPDDAAATATGIAGSGEGRSS